MAHKYGLELEFRLPLGFGWSVCIQCMMIAEVKWTIILSQFECDTNISPKRHKHNSRVSIEARILILGKCADEMKRKWAIHFKESNPICSTKNYSLFFICCCSSYSSFDGLTLSVFGSSFLSIPFLRIYSNAMSPIECAKSAQQLFHISRLIYRYGLLRCNYTILCWTISCLMLLLRQLRIGADEFVWNVNMYV